MKYIIDTEFVDTPEYSELISIGIVCENGAELYFEFEYPIEAITPWLAEHVVPSLLGGDYVVSFETAANTIKEWIGRDVPQFWAYFGSYDMYWFSRLFGGFMSMPKHWDILLCHDFAHYQRGVPPIAGAAHNALADAKSVLAAMQRKGLAQLPSEDRARD